MTNKQNEVATYKENEFDTVTGEVVIRNEYQPQVVEENEEFVVFKMPNGKFVRKAKYKNFSSFVAETREEKIWLLNLVDSDENDGIGKSLKKHVGEEITVQDVITRPYDKIDEDTGQLEYGVITYFITPEKDVYVTSSKSPYFSIWNIMDMFGKAGTPEWQNIVLKVGSVTLPNGEGLTIKMIG